MTTWTMEQVSQAERLVTRLAVDDELIQRDPERAQQAAEDAMAKEFTRLAHSFVIEVDRRDLEITWTRDPATPWRVMGEMRWRPATQAVELRGGHLDGQRVAVQRLGEPLKIPRLVGTPWWSNDDERATAALTEVVNVYEMSGWREDERVWVYEARR